MKRLLIFFSVIISINLNSCVSHLDYVLGIPIYFNDFERYSDTVYIIRTEIGNLNNKIDSTSFLTGELPDFYLLEAGDEDGGYGEFMIKIEPIGIIDTISEIIIKSRWGKIKSATWKYNDELMELGESIEISKYDKIP